MSAVLSPRRPVQPDPLEAIDRILDQLERDARPPEISLGTCVRVSWGARRSRARMTEEGVVIEVVPADSAVRSARVRLRTPIAEAPRYVVQCWTFRVVRYASELLVVSL